MKQTLLLFVLSFSVFVLNAQDVDKKPLSYTYIQLPEKSVKPIANYQSFIEMAYEQKSIDATESAKTGYDQEIAIWEKQCAAERARYDKEMSEYNAKSGAKKVLEKEFLNEGKPVLRLPAKPVRQERFIQKLFDKKMYAGSYLMLEGFTNAPNNALKYTVVLFGFEYFEPELQTVSTTTEKNGVKETKYSYSYKIQYKHSMSARVEMPDGTVLLNQAFDKFNAFSTYTTNGFPSEYELNKSFNKMAVLAHLEESITTENIKKVNIAINDKYGFAKRNRDVKLYTVQSSKKADYSDFQAAYENVKEGLSAVGTDKDKAKMFLDNAATQLEKILAESNPADKKARIDKKVTEAACKDAFEVYIMMNNFDACRKVIEKLKSLEPSKSDLKEIEELKAFLNDTEYRFKANQ